MIQFQSKFRSIRIITRTSPSTLHWTFPSSFILYVPTSSIPLLPIYPIYNLLFVNTIFGKYSSPRIDLFNAREKKTQGFVEMEIRWSAEFAYIWSARRARILKELASFERVSLISNSATKTYNLVHGRDGSPVHLPSPLPYNPRQLRFLFAFKTRWPCPRDSSIFFFYPPVCNAMTFSEESTKIDKRGGRDIFDISRVIELFYTRQVVSITGYMT